MAFEHYEFFTDESSHEFEFFSEGPRGAIKKVVQFSPRSIDDNTFFNLAFGDWDEKKNNFDDMAVTNNQDTKKVLATVAAIVLAFTKQFPKISVFATGSTPARTRLYQMGISENWEEVGALVNVFGSKNNEWQPFKKGVNYDSFFVRKR